MWDDEDDEVERSAGARELADMLAGIPPLDMSVDWSVGNCLGEAPQLWDVDFYRSTTEAKDAAKVLCEGCPLRAVCATDALKPLGRRSTSAGRLIRQTGVIRAGVVMDGSKGATVALRHAAGLQGHADRPELKRDTELIDRVRELRSQGLFQHQIATRLGVSRSTVQRICVDSVDAA